ncbi:MAG: tyrosine--tRNA ligase [Deltaproteobacteria bacterium]|nr:tyrosine--tRNA ligase [Deltaproteobacteria bacterium]MBW2200730.1 tyrosine--tRNA ligase [Deltaproteobacteria bacterium]MBW2540242.1 tyrosine--tRNA ligase [Deltaproteobacteria bacterium]
MTNVIHILKARGFIEDTTHDQELHDFINKGDVSCYIGFDPTASSLHVGSLIPIMSLSHMQREGHRPIALIGGGTGLVGDPSGKTEMRKLLSMDVVKANAIGIKKQLSRFIDFSDGKAILLNNADWLTKLEYIPFLRDIGRHFSVNRMIKAESYKLRLDSKEGLSFIEFNYMILQAYDFLRLFYDYGCRLQMGGSDQWGNIVAGVELVRRVHHETVFGITFPLITSSGGEKMGKTAKGAVWLDPAKTTPYEYYQYWINTDDLDVERFVALFTFLPMDEVRKIGKLKDADLNSAKAILAFETTLLVHGREEAIKAHYAAASMFGARVVPKGILPSSSIPRNDTAMDDISVPHSYLDMDTLQGGLPAFKLFHMVGLATSGGAARRLIEQGGAYLNGKRIETFDFLITNDDMNNMELLLRAGKKRFHKIKIKK